ncbi:serine-rich adhesin for platelets-like isoform X2 [Watersipora subatra]
MEQCISRPPEKVLIMPSSTSSTARSPPPTTNKKPRSSLLSIISGTDRKSPNPSVSSSNEDPISPPPSISPTENSTLTSGPISKLSSKCADQEIGSASTEKEKPAKKIPPPTLAKTFKSKSFSTTPTPSPTAESKTILSTSVTSVSVPATVTEVSETTEKSLNEKASSTNEPVVAESEREETAYIVSSTSLEIAQHSKETTVLTKTIESTRKGSETVSEGVDNIETDSKGSEKDQRILTSTDDSNNECEQISLEDIDLPPPIDLDLLGVDDVDNAEFPPPPEIELLTDIDSLLNDTPPTSNADLNVQLEKAEMLEEVDLTKNADSNYVYGTSESALCNEEAQLHNSANPDPGKHNTLTIKSASDSEDTHDTASHDLNNETMEKSVISAHDSPLAAVEVHNLSAVSDLQDTSGQPKLEPNKTEPSAREDTNEKMSPSGHTESKLTDSSEPGTGDSDSINHLICPPTLPVTSSFSALDTSVSTQTSDATQDSLSSSLAKTEVSQVTDASQENAETLTVAQHTNDSGHDSGRASAATSPAPHSPPFNTSSESGDSGVESGIYSLVGETVTVKLRPTINDNRKPESAVPMFDRNSSELKRVTFRETTNQATSTVVTTQKSAAEQHRIARTGLSEDDISQAELFYKGHKTEVMVCPCLATLYMAESRTSENIPMESWKPEHIGIPVLIFDTGAGKRHCGLTMVFAEKGTGFLLWRNEINYESRWEVIEPVFHQLHVKGDTFAGIAFQDEKSAIAFYDYFQTCTSDPEKNVLNNPNLRNNKKSKKDKKKSVKRKVTPLPNKSAISKPCEFTHVTQLKQSADGLMASAMIPVEEEDGSEDGRVKFA